MKGLLYVGIMWTLYGMMGFFGFQNIKEKYRNHDWTKEYIRYRGKARMMIGIPWMVLYWLTDGRALSVPLMGALILLPGVPLILYTIVNERKYRQKLEGE